ncbi:MAG: hypothetical protein OI715_01160 (plasmid) [Candidatus Methanoperedens sp.]|nr:MAG: hypothetical protein OI715_01160 [Candidatus Methanoperedens sp.]
MNEIPECPKNLPDNITQTIRDLGKQWNLEVPKIKPDTLRKWDDLIDEWLSATDIPIIVRKGGLKRGHEITHKTGRKIIISDNSPAQWVCCCAFIDVVPTIDKIPDLLKNEIPIAFVLKTKEKDAKYNQTLKKYSINKKGWKLCHKDDVGLNERDVSQIDIEIVKKSFLYLMKPSNFFLVPKEWSGLGELKDFIEEMK